MQAASYNTSLYARWEVIDRLLDYVDLVLCDIKHLDSEMHRVGTGVGNELILENLGKVAKKKRIWIRIPLIPNYNDSEQHIKEVAEFLSGNPVEKTSLLPYHEYGKPKYGALGRGYPLKGDNLVISEGKLKSLQDVIASYALPVTLRY